MQEDLQTEGELKVPQKSNAALKKASTKSLDIIIGGAIFLIFFLVPIYFTGMAAQGLGFEKMILFYFLVLVGVVAWVFKGVIQGELNLKRTPLDIPVLVFLVLAFVSSIMSVSIRDSVIGSYGQSTKGFASILIFALFYYLLVNNATRTLVKNIFSGLVTSTSIIAIYSLLQLFGKFVLPMSFTKSINFNPLGSASALAMFFTVMLPIMVVFVAQYKEIFVKSSEMTSLALRTLAGLGTLASLFAMFLLNGFTFWQAGLVGIIITLMFFLSKIVKITNNNIIFPVGVFLVLVILLVLGNFNLFNLQLPAEVSLSRSASWDIARSSLKHDPLLGFGPSTYSYVFSKYKSMNFNATPLWNVRFDSATGVIFELLATYGALGTIAFLILILTVISISFMSLVKTKDNELQSIGLGLFSGLVSLVILSLLFAMNNSVILIFIMVAVLSAVISIVTYPEEFKVLKLSFRSSANYALALAAIFLSVSAGVVILFTMGLKMYLADVYASKSILVSDNVQKVDYLNRAIALSPYRDDYYLQIANAYMALANQDALNKGDQTAIQNNLSLAIESGKKAIDLNPEKAADNESLALIYENASFYTRGALEWSEKYYNKVIELDPNNPTPNLRIALVNMARANAETDKTEKEYYMNEALKKYDEALAKKDDLAAAQYGKGITYEKLANLDKAIESLRNATILSRNNIDYRFELGRLYFNKGVSQPDIAQNATKEITTGEGENGLSAQTNQPVGATITKNADLQNAEQLFLSIISENPNHANALYSLAVLYQKTGEKENAKAAVTRLIEILQDGPTKDAVKQQFQGLY